MTARPMRVKRPKALLTMARFLEAAEGIFGRHGYEGTTVRDIAARSGVNLGTLKHYWGSKRELFRDLMERRLRPLHDETSARLAALAAGIKSGATPDPGEVVACLVEPAFLIGVQSPPDLDFRDEESRRRLHRFFGRCLSDPSPEIVKDLNEMFADVTNQFFELMRQACPEVTQAELDWRINCVFGTVSFAQLYGERVGRFLGTEADVGDELASQWVMHFITRGIAARPAPKKTVRRTTAEVIERLRPQPVPRRHPSTGRRKPR